MTAMEKKDKNLNVPNLRFPEFSGEWERFRNCTLFKVISEKNKNYEFFTVLSASQTEGMVLRDSLGIDIKFEEDSIKTYKIVRNGDYVAHLRSFQGGFAFSDKTGVCSPAYTILRPSETISYGFLKPYFMSRKFIDSLRIVTYGIRDGKSISVEEWLKLYTCIPKKNEQQKISKFLRLIDNRIETQKKIIEKYESLIRGLITDVNSGRIAQCKSVYLRDLLTEQHEKNTNNYEVCSVSVSQGVINQIDYLGRSFAAKEVLHYNVVNCGDIVYTKSPTGEFPYGIVKRSDITKPIAVSPLYGVYHPINDYVGRYLHLYFKNPINAKNYLHKLVQKGAKNTINITNQHFLDNKILIPEKGWLDKIVKFATAIEMKIATENKVLQTLQQQKDYLLSKMFI